MDLKKFSAALAAIALSMIGLIAVAAPASATSFTGTVTTSGSFDANTNTPQFTVNSTLEGAFNQVYIQIPGGMSAWTYNLSTCGNLVTHSSLADCGISTGTIGGTAFHDAYKSGSSIYLTVVPSPVTPPAGGSALVLTFDANTFTTAGAGATQMMIYSSMGATVDQITAAITVNAPSETVTFDANDGSGATTTQSASTQTALTTNSFTRSGYSFGGWATSAGSTTVAYADGADYSFGSSTTLYAIWNASGGSGGSGSSNSTSGLASTGAETIVPIGTAATLLLVGAALMLMRHRREV